MNPKYYGYIITGVVVLAIFAFRFSRMNVARPFRPELLWIWPVLLTLGAGFFFYNFPPRTPMETAEVVGVFAVGALIGWWRGRLITIAVHPEHHTLTAQTSAASILFLLVLFGVRFALRFFLLKGVAPDSPEALRIDGWLLAFAVGVLGVARLEMFVRAQKLLGKARAATA